MKESCTVCTQMRNVWRIGVLLVCLARVIVSLIVKFSGSELLLQRHGERINPAALLPNLIYTRNYHLLAALVGSSTASPIFRSNWMLICSRMTLSDYLSVSDEITKVPNGQTLADLIFTPDCLASLRLFDSDAPSAAARFAQFPMHKVWLSQRFRAQNSDPQSFSLLLQKGWEIRDNPSVVLDNWNSLEESDLIPAPDPQGYQDYFHISLWDTLELANGPIWQTLTVKIFTNADSASRIKIMQVLDRGSLSRRSCDEFAGDAMELFMRLISLCALAHVHSTVPRTRENSPLHSRNQRHFPSDAEQVPKFFTTSTMNIIQAINADPNASLEQVDYERATLYELASELIEFIRHKPLSEHFVTALFFRLLNIDYGNHVQFGDWFLNLLVIFQHLYPTIDPNLARQALTLFYSKSPSASAVCQLVTILGLEHSENSSLEQVFEETLPNHYIPLIYKMECTPRQLPRVAETVPFIERWQKFTRTMRTRSHLYIRLQAALSFEIDSTSPAYIALFKAAFAISMHVKSQRQPLLLEQIASITDSALGKTRNYSLKELINYFFTLFMASGLYITNKSAHARPIIVPSPLLPLPFWCVLGQFIAQAAIHDIVPPFLLERQLFRTLVNVSERDLATFKLSSTLFQQTFDEYGALNQEVWSYLQSFLFWLADKPEFRPADMPEFAAKMEEFLTLLGTERTQSPRSHMRSNHRRSITLNSHSKAAMVHYRELEESERSSRININALEAARIKAMIRLGIETMGIGFRRGHPSVSEFTEPESYVLIFKVPSLHYIQGNK
jgi:hypothetical protein